MHKHRALAVALPQHNAVAEQQPTPYAYAVCLTMLAVSVQQALLPKLLGNLLLEDFYPNASAHCRWFPTPSVRVIGDVV